MDSCHHIVGRPSVDIGEFHQLDCEQVWSGMLFHRYVCLLQQTRCVYRLVYDLENVIRSNTK